VQTPEAEFDQRDHVDKNSSQLKIYKTPALLAKESKS